MRLSLRNAEVATNRVQEARMVSSLTAAIRAVRTPARPTKTIWHHHWEIKTMTRTILASLLLGVSLAASSKTTLLEHIPLQWRPTSDLRLGTTQMTASTVTVAT